MTARFPRRWVGDWHHRHFVAHPKISTKLVHKCSCGRKVRRSWRTGILHTYCFACRYLRMIYGPNITIKYKEK